MKLTKFFAASLAAVTLFSCSKELTQTPEAILNPGDARIEVNIGKTVTTYATSAEELSIKNSMYALYSADGTKKLTTTPTPGTPAGTISFSVPAAEVAANPTATLVVVANAQGFTSNGTDPITAMPATLTLARAMRIQGQISDAAAALGKGIPSSQSYDVSLVGGTTVKLDKKLERAAARIFVKANGGNDYANIVDYNIAYTGAATANLVTRTVVADAPKSATITYVVKAAAAADSFKGTQAVGYVYPSSATQGSFTVTNKTGVQRTITFAAQPNMNYGVNIITTPDADGSVEFELAIQEWADGADINIDFGTVDDGLVHFLKMSPVANGVAGIYGAAVVESDTKATVTFLPAQIAKISLVVPAGYTLAPAVINGEVSFYDDDKTLVFINPDRGDLDWSGTVNVVKDGTTAATIDFKRAGVTVVNYNTINIFEPWKTTGLLTTVNVHSATDATIGVTPLMQANFKFAVPTGYNFKVVSGTDIDAANPNTSTNWAYVNNGLPRVTTRNNTKACEVVFEILNGTTRVATFKIVRPAL